MPASSCKLKGFLAVMGGPWGDPPDGWKPLCGPWEDYNGVLVPFDMAIQMACRDDLADPELYGHAMFWLFEQAGMRQIQSNHKTHLIGMIAAPMFLHHHYNRP